MSSMDTPSKRENIQLDAQRQRDAEISRHEISKLAYELLQKRLDVRNVANEQTNLEELARVGEENAINAARLVVEHEKEKTEFEDARFAMIVEFDAQRDELLRAPRAKKLEKEEGLRHTTLLESLQARLARDDQEAEQALQKAIEEYERTQQAKCSYSGCRILNFRMNGTACSNCGRRVAFADIPEVINARSQAQMSTLERHNNHQQLVDHHNAQWKLRQEALRLEIVDNRASRQARLDLEYDFQRRFAKRNQRQKAIQQRHAKELEALENERNMALAVVQQANERAKEELLEERLRVEGWWQHLRDESEATLRRIYGDERRTLEEIDRRDIAAAVEVEGEAWSVEAEVASGTVAAPLQEVKGQMPFTVVGEDEEETLATTRSTADDVASVPGPSEMARSFAGTACGDDDSSGTSVNGKFHGASSGSPISLADVNQGQAVIVAPDRSPHTLAQDLASARVTPHDNGLQINMTTSPSSFDPAYSVPGRSGSPDSGCSDSDFVEI